jgi:transposase
MLRRAPLTPISGNKTVRKELDLLIKGKIAGQAELGATFTQISRNLNVPRTTVHEVLSRLQTTSFGVNKPRSGRPLSITPRAVRILLRQLRSEPKITWRQLKTNTGIDLDARTLNATLRAHGISHWLALKRPKLTSEAARLRLIWAKTHKDWTVNQWRKVIWSDEASVTRGSDKTREWVFGTPKEKWDRDKVMEVPNGKAFSNMVWGAFWDSGRSDLYLLDRDFESKKHGYSAASYIQILDHNLAGIWEPELVFMQDNAPIHRARKSKLWFQGNGIEVMEWPPYSPDLNPIENLWALLKKETYKVYPDLDSLKGKGDEAETQLFQILQKAWANLREEVMEGLISSMPDRCAAVIIAKGWHTKY